MGTNSVNPFFAKSELNLVQKKQKNAKKMKKTVRKVTKSATKTGHSLTQNLPTFGEKQNNQNPANTGNRGNRVMLGALLTHMLNAMHFAYAQTDRQTNIHT
jgi:hypothetical protein